MIGIVVGGSLVMFALYKLYFLLKPMILISKTLIKTGIVTDIKLYTDEIENLRVELLELNDAYYNEMNALEKRVKGLEILIENQKRSLYKTYQEKESATEISSIKNESLQLDKTDGHYASKIVHPLFDRVKGLYKLGFKDQDIARELGMGVSEVKLLIKRMEEQ